MAQKRRPALTTLMFLNLYAGGCGQDDGNPPLAHTLFVGFADNTVASYNIADGSERPGSIANAPGLTDMQALEGGLIGMNLTDSNEVLFFDGSTMQEKARIPSSAIGAMRPVHSFVSPTISGKRFWVANSDGAVNAPATNGVSFIDINPASSTYLTAIGGTAIGAGHHVDAFSDTKPRVSVSDIADCAVVVQVIDYTSAATPSTVKTFSAADLDPAADCKASAPTPHGAAYSSLGKHGYHNLIGWGKIMSVAQDADPPVAKLLPTAGSGVGYTKEGKDGRYIYALQGTPREGNTAMPGVDCQIGQLVVIDGMTDSIAKQVPLLYRGAGCTEKIAGTPAAAVAPDNIVVAKDGKTLFIASQGVPYSDQELVVDITDPANPVQKASITLGKHSDHRRQIITGDGKYVFVVNGMDNSVSRIDTTSLTAMPISVKGTPKQLSSYGTAAGPSAQIGP